MQTVYDLLRRLADDHHWRNEADKVTAHGVINAADPNYVPPVPTQGPNLTPEQLYIRDLEAQLAAARGVQAAPPQNASEQLAAAYGTPMAYAQPQNMQQYAYPVPPTQPTPPAPMAMPQPQVPTLGPQMRQYQYPQPAQQAVQVTPFQ